MARRPRSLGQCLRDTRSGALPRCPFVMTAAAPWESLGLLIGHATDDAGATGCTVLRALDRPFRCSAALVGRASATRELGTCAPEHLVDRTDAILLSGGSAYGLDAAAGVMQWMEEQQRGFAVSGGVVPIVPAACIYDLTPLGRFDARPTAEMAYHACASAALHSIAEGSVGAGTGALVGKGAGIARAMKGGVGVSAVQGAQAVAGALAVVNAFGDVRNSAGEIISGARAEGGGFADIEARMRDTRADVRFPSSVREHTTLACVAVSATLTKLELSQLAESATTALRRRISPSATSFDGDVVFAVAPHDGPIVALPVLESLVIAALEDAIERAVRLARGREGFPGLADMISAGAHS